MKALIDCGFALVRVIVVALLSSTHVSSPQAEAQPE